jgi:alanine transaminase
LPIVSQLYPQDAIERARTLLSSIGSVGAYSHSQGVPSIRQTVANFLQERDAHAANPNHIFLTQGASSGVQTLLSMLTENPNSGIMIPIPQYPLYSASLALYGSTPIIWMNPLVGVSTLSSSFRLFQVHAKVELT